MSKVEAKSNVTLQQAVRYLEDLVKTLKAGKLVVQNDGEFVTLDPTDPLELELKAARKDDKQKFELRLSWRAPAAPVAPSALTISSEEPPTPEPEAATGAADESGAATGAAEGEGKKRPAKKPA